MALVSLACDTGDSVNRIESSQTNRLDYTRLQAENAVGNLKLWKHVY